MKRITKQNKIVIGIISLILVLTVGYALFSETLNINGTAKASGEFNIIFSSVGKTTGKESSISPEPQITNNGKTLKITGVKLNMPTAYLDVPATIENTGSIDAKVKGIDITGLDDLDIEVSYSGVHQNQILKSKDTAPITIRIEWKKESTVTSKNLSFTIDINYEQVTEQDIVSTPKVAYDVGDTIKLGNEEFFVIEKSDETKETVTALAKYNLKVGNNVVFNFDLRDIESITPIATDSEGYGLQHESMKGTLMTDVNWNGVTAFSDIDYWAGETYGKPLPKYGESYPANVFDSNSKLYTHVKFYENYLRKKLGYDSVRASLMTYEQLIGLGCKRNENSCTTNAPSWVYDTSYWSETVSGSTIWGVFSNGNFGDIIYREIKDFGVRPVITISKSDI